MSCELLLNGRNSFQCCIFIGMFLESIRKEFLKETRVHDVLIHAHTHTHRYNKSAIALKIFSVMVRVYTRNDLTLYKRFLRRSLIG